MLIRSLANSTISANSKLPMNGSSFNESIIFFYFLSRVFVGESISFSKNELEPFGTFSNVLLLAIKVTTLQSMRDLEHDAHCITSHSSAQKVFDHEQ